MHCKRDGYLSYAKMKIVKVRASERAWLAGHIRPYVHKNGRDCLAQDNSSTQPLVIWSWLKGFRVGWDINVWYQQPREGTDSKCGVLAFQWFSFAKVKKL